MKELAAMNINDKSCRVIKLKSGDEIIAKVKGKENGNFLLERPMQIKTTLMHDELGNITDELCMMRSWLANTNQLVCKVPEDFVALMLPPNPPVALKYKLELEKEDTFMSIANKIDPDGQHDLSDIDRMLKEYFQNQQPPQKGLLPGMPPAPPPGGNQPEDEGEMPPKNFVVLQFAMPKEDFMELMKQTDFEIPEDVMDDILGAENRDESAPDWGNRWTDWPKDVQDFFDDDDDDDQLA